MPSDTPHSKRMRDEKIESDPNAARPDKAHQNLTAVTAIVPDLDNEVVPEGYRVMGRTLGGTTVIHEARGPVARKFEDDKKGAKEEAELIEQGVGAEEYEEVEEEVEEEDPTTGTKKKTKKKVRRPKAKGKK